MKKENQYEIIVDLLKIVNLLKKKFSIFQHYVEEKSLLERAQSVTTMFESF